MKIRPHRLVPLAVLLLVATGCQSLKTPHKLPVIDTHVHLWDTSRPEMTWPRQGHPLFKPFLPAQHKPICAANGVDGVVVVLSGQALVDNQWNLDVTAHNPGLYRGVVGNMSKAIGTDEFAPLFLKLCKDPRYVGYRLSGRPANGIDAAFMRDLHMTAENGKTLDVLIGGYTLDEVSEIARRIPKLKIIVDHFGGVNLSESPLDPAWVASFRKVAERPNVYCKFSALYGRFKQQPAPKNLPTYKPVMDLAYECFGPDRLVYGSDWPVTIQTADYASVINLSKAYFANKSAQTARKVFHDNAVEFYNLPQ